MAFESVFINDKVYFCTNEIPVGTNIDVLIIRNKSDKCHLMMESKGNRVLLGFQDREYAQRFIDTNYGENANTVEITTVNMKNCKANCRCLVNLEWQNDKGITFIDEMNKILESNEDYKALYEMNNSPFAMILNPILAARYDTEQKAADIVMDTLFSMATLYNNVLNTVANNASSEEVNNLIAQFEDMEAAKDGEEEDNKDE